MPIATVNPATGVKEETFEPFDEAEVNARLELASATFAEYRLTSLAERARWMTSAAELVEGEIPDLARIITTEMGKTFAQAKAEAGKCAMAMRWFADNAFDLLRDEPAPVGKSGSRIAFEPLGPVLAVMPWNFPMWQVIRFAAPNLMAGNVGLLKHSSNVPRTALAIEDLFRRAGFPDGAFQTLLIGSESVERVIEHPSVAAVTLTGSQGAGRAVAAAAGKALKKSVLELGGSDPFLVMASADLDRAVSTGVQARVQNNGQSCIAAKRFIVHDAVYDEFESRFTEAMASLSVGDPFEPSTEVGPLASAAQLAEVSAQVEDARAKGATVLCGAEVLQGPGFYYRPTVLSGITSDMAVARDEVFGPVAMLYRAKDTHEAIELANASRFGLGASIWSTDPDEQHELIRGLEAGMVFVNAMVVSMPQMPFGGVKASGYGRELAREGIREFCNAKTVFVG